MNPMERALAQGEKVVAANAQLEAGSRSPSSHVHGLQHGQKVAFKSPDGSGQVEVSYHRRQSQGDNGKNVPGAYTGEYTVDFPSGRSQSFSHGPHATTPMAAKRGANPHAKAYAAENAWSAVTRHLTTAGTFNDRR